MAYTVTQAYRCDEYCDDGRGWAVEINNKFFGLGTTWAEALERCAQEAIELHDSGDGDNFEGDTQEFFASGVVIPRKIRFDMIQNVKVAGGELPFKCNLRNW